MRPIVLVPLSLFVVAAAACQTGPQPAPVVPTVYQYTAYDRQGAPVVTGTLALTTADDVVSGQWTLAPAIEGIEFGQVGPQLGEGNLGGRFDHGALVLNLQPGAIDNYVLLRGNVRDNLYAGRWQYLGFGGVVAEGSFLAVRQ